MDAAASGGSTSPDDFQLPPSPPDDLGEILAFTDLQTFGLSLAGGQRAGYIGRQILHTKLDCSPFIDRTRVDIVLVVLRCVGLNAVALIRDMKGRWHVLCHWDELSIASYIAIHCQTLCVVRSV